MSGKKEEKRALGAIKKSISSYSVRWRMGQVLLRGSGAPAGGGAVGTGRGKVDASRSFEGHPTPPLRGRGVTASRSLSAIRRHRV